MGSPYLHHLDLREVPRGDLVFSLQLNVDFRQPADELPFLVFLPKDTGHLLLQVADDVGMHLQGYTAREGMPCRYPLTTMLRGRGRVRHPGTEAEKADLNDIFELGAGQIYKVDEPLTSLGE